MLCAGMAVTTCASELRTITLSITEGGNAIDFLARTSNPLTLQESLGGTVTLSSLASGEETILSLNTEANRSPLVLVENIDGVIPFTATVNQTSTISWSLSGVLMPTDHWLRWGTSETNLDQQVMPTNLGNGLFSADITPSLAGTLYLSVGVNDARQGSVSSGVLSQPVSAAVPTGLIGSWQLIMSSAQAGSPYANDASENFVVSADGNLTIGSGQTLMNPIQSGSELIWTDGLSGLQWRLSNTQTGNFNEINLFGDSGSTFLGSFRESNNNPGLIGSYSGTYAVSTITKGTHSRGSVIIAADGTIDFDTGVVLNPGAIALETDRRDVLDRVLIDYNPYPDAPHQRIVLVVDATGTMLIGMEYWPQYSGVSGRVFIGF
jgi:hypothetical protein